MKLTEDLTREALLANLHSKFLMRFPNAEPLELELLSVTDLPGSAGQEQMSAVFLAPPQAPAAQGLYELEHEHFGTFGIFLVPIALDQKGLQYEAIFNRLNV